MSKPLSSIAEQVLRALGLDPICVQVYLTMHAEPDADTAQIAERLSLQPAEVVDALDELADLTLLRPGLAPSAGRLRPVALERALRTLLRQQADQLRAQNASLSALQSAVDEMLAVRPPRADSMHEVDVEVITGGETMQAKFEELGVRARESLDSMLPGGPVRKETLDAARQTDEELVQRGVRARALYQSSIKNDRTSMEYLRWLSSLGTEIRCAPIISARIVLFDRNTAVVSHRQPSLPTEMFIIHEAGLVAPLNALFELSWAVAEPLENSSAKPAEPEAGPGSQELALLQLLASGSTDDAAAKRLGVSVRTVRRMMADLMDRLGSSSRFEAGHKATQRGWL